jgi:hypothetical protein
MLNRGLFLLGIALLSAALAEARPRVRLGSVTVGGGYTHFGGYYPYYHYPYWSRLHAPWGYPFCDPWFASCFHPGYFTGFARRGRMGEVRLRSEEKDAAVYLDGGYAGTADKLKTIWLEPGAYQLELRHAKGTYARKIYVLSGKSLTIRPEFQP